MALSMDIAAASGGKLHKHRNAVDPTTLCITCARALIQDLQRKKLMVFISFAELDHKVHLGLCGLALGVHRDDGVLHLAKGPLRGLALFMHSDDGVLHLAKGHLMQEVMLKRFLLHLVYFAVLMFWELSPSKFRRGPN